MVRNLNKIKINTLLDVKNKMVENAIVDYVINHQIKNGPFILGGDGWLKYQIIFVPMVVEATSRECL